MAPRRALAFHFLRARRDTSRFFLAATKEFYVFETFRLEKLQCCISILVTQVS